MVFDFSEIKKIVDTLDHTHLNYHDAFRHRNPTAENIAEWIADEVDEVIGISPARVKSVRVQESEGNEAWFIR
jgi:6-pyruvoyltetrahydropterin/6-carboxytetrahydropterin synthase